MMVVVFTELQEKEDEEVVEPRGVDCCVDGITCDENEHGLTHA